MEKTIRQIKRIIIGVIGFTVFLIGIAMIVLPGPAILVIPLSLAILATEFVWARRLLKKLKDKLPRPKGSWKDGMEPSEKEEEYFARMEFERKKKSEEEKRRHRRLKEGEKKRLKE